MKFRLLILFLFILAATGGILTQLSSDGALLSPLLEQLNPPPDLTRQLSQKLYSPPRLNYSYSTTLDTISDKIIYLVYNPTTAEVYLAKGHNQRISPASFTKLMTAQVAFDVANDPKQLLTATKTSINKEPTVLGLKTGEQLTIEDLVRAAIATSANDAAATLAEGIADFYNQSLSFFIDLMNQKAQLLKMSHTNFANPEGYDDDNQYSSLEDIFILVSNAQKNYPYILYSGKSDMDDIATSSAHGRYYLPNWNGLLGVYPGVDGLKIAYTEKAGYSTIITADRQNKPVVVIMQGAQSIRERDLAAAALLDAAYIKEKIPPANITRNKLDQHYKQWKELADRIKQELKDLGLE